jgi:hypothetical protein
MGMHVNNVSFKSPSNTHMPRRFQVPPQVRFPNMFYSGRIAIRYHSVRHGVQNPYPPLSSCDGSCALHVYVEFCGLFIGDIE